MYKHGSGGQSVVNSNMLGGRAEYTFERENVYHDDEGKSTRLCLTRVLVLLLCVCVSSSTHHRRRRQLVLLL